MLLCKKTFPFYQIPKVDLVVIKVKNFGKIIVFFSPERGKKYRYNHSYSEHFKRSSGGNKTKGYPSVSASMTIKCLDRTKMEFFFLMFKIQKLNLQ